MIVKTLQLITLSCPLQGCGHLEDGRMYYFRYRYGTFELHLSKEATRNVDDALLGDLLFRWQDKENPFDGTMEGAQLKLLLIDAGFSIPPFIEPYLDYDTNPQVPSHLIPLYRNLDN